MTATSDTENYEAFGIAVDMIMAKYRDADADIITERMSSFVTKGPTAEDNGRRMGYICQSLATLGGQLASVIGQLSPAAIDQFFGEAEAVSRGDAAV